MKNKIINYLILLTLLMLMVSRSTAAPIDGDLPAWESKVSPQVLDEVQGGETEFLVIMKDQADLSQAANLKTKDEKGEFVYQTLTAFAEASQKPVRATLDDLGVEYRPFWIVNLLWVRGDYDTLQQIASLDRVSRIDANPSIPIKIPEISTDTMHPLAVDAIEWNISLINAPTAWDHGYTGEGIVIGGQDTGYDWDHPALKDKYRGWDGATADHNYNWHDAIEASTEPIDPHYHGTHTMGTMVGDDGGANQIGVAPGAKWIGCRNMDASGNGTPISYIECYQWFVAPYDLIGDDIDKDPSKAPHVINNSWSCPASEGCSISDTKILTAVLNVRDAGIVTVHSAGNEGSSCETVTEIAAIYDESFSIGATNSSDSIASFSSRGPVTVDGSGRLKPNVVAPGVDIRSSLPGGGYNTSGWNGTSMAAPHVAGLVALLLSANPDLIGQVDQIERIIERSAVPLTTSQNCGSIPGSTIPNNTYGWGRVDAWAAILESFTWYFPLIFK